MIVLSGTKAQKETNKNISRPPDNNDANKLLDNIQKKHQMTGSQIIEQTL